MNKKQNEQLLGPNDLFKGVRLNKANLFGSIKNELPKSTEN